MSTTNDEYTRDLLFVGGKFTTSTGSDSYDVVEAATENALGRSVLGTEADIDVAVAAARAALTGPWGSSTIDERADMLEAFASALKARGRSTSRLVTRENGMPIALSGGVNGFGPAMIVDYYAQLIRNSPRSDVRPSVFGGRTDVQRSPVGVVAAITPWNYPQPLAAMKLAPALAAGCTVVLKPSPETALDAFAFAEAAIEAGLPAGVLNVVPAGREVSSYLVSHPGVDKVAFTGSTGAGRAIGEVCGRLLRPVTLELGGKSAALIAEDADLDVVARAILDVSLVNNGQTCHASTRILAPRSRYAEVVDAVTEAVRALTVGDPLDKATQIGPLVSAAQRQRVLGYIADGKDAGYRVTTGGGVPSSQPKGWFVEPTVFADVDNSARIAQEEIFGPVLTVIGYDTEDDAIDIANDSEYGLGGTVWSADEQHGLELARRIESGSVGVNYYALDFSSPFGGIKSSGLGRELGPEGIAPYFTSKSIYFERP